MPIETKHPRTLTDEIVEKEVPKGGNLRIVRDQDSLTQGPGGVDVVIRIKSGKTYMTVVPRTDSIPPTEGSEEVIWSRR